MKIYRKNHLRSENGAALVESSLILPLFMLLIAMIVDCAIMLNQYYILSRISYTATRMASEYPQLEKGTFENLDLAGIQYAHHGLQTRIRQVIEAYGTRLSAPVDVITARLDDSRQIVYTNPSNDQELIDIDSDITRVVLKMQYRTLWSQAIGIYAMPLSIKSEGVYLLN